MSNIYKQTTLIPDAYLAEYSPIPTNFDFNEIHPFVSIAESVHIVPIIGKALYSELLEEVKDNDVTDVNSTLLLKLYPLLSISTVYEASPFILTHISEKGWTVGKSDNSDSISFTDLNNLQNHLKAQMSVLKENLKTFLEDNKECYPLYSAVADCCNSKLDGDIRLYSSNVKRKPKNF